MRPIIPLEFLGFKKLDFDLYDENGNVIYQQGEPITSSKLLRLTQLKVFRRQDSILHDINAPIPEGPPPDIEYQSKISETATNLMIINARKIVTDAISGRMPDIKMCRETVDVIIDEVTDKIEHVQCIGQLRIYDEYTFSHTVNVASMSAALASYVKMSEQDINDLTLSALLHDIGKMRVPIEILNKPGKLSQEEFQKMKDHTILGYDYLMHETGLSENVALAALQHQEKHGGGGYPYGLKGDEISVYAQITSIVDVYDALVSTRVYKKAILSHDAIKMMISEGSHAFNPSLLYKFIYLANMKNSKNIVTFNDK